MRRPSTRRDCPTMTFSISRRSGSTNPLASSTRILAAAVSNFVTSYWWRLDNRAGDTARRSGDPAEGLLNIRHFAVHENDLHVLVRVDRLLPQLHDCGRFTENSFDLLD